MRRHNDLLRHVLRAQLHEDEIIPHPLAVAVQRDAFGFEALDRPLPVPEALPDFVLHDFIQHAFGQIVAGGLELVQHQLPVDEGVDVLAAHLIELLPVHLRLVGILPPQHLDSLLIQEALIVEGDDRLMHHRAHAVEELRARTCNAKPCSAAAHSMSQ